MLRRLRDGIPLAVVGDSKFLIDCCLGRAHTTQPSIRRNLRVALEASRQLVGKLFARTFGTQELFIHTPRKANSQADAAANQAWTPGTLKFSMGRRS